VERIKKLVKHKKYSIRFIEKFFSCDKSY
jgi:hypothetical protein